MVSLRGCKLVQRWHGLLGGRPSGDCDKGRSEIHSDINSFTDDSNRTILEDHQSMDTEGAAGEDEFSVYPLHRYGYPGRRMDGLDLPGQRFPKGRLVSGRP